MDYILATSRLSFLLNGISFVVRSFVRSLVSALSFCTVLLYSSVVHVRMCSKQNTRRTTGTRRDTRHGHYTGNSSTGTSRPRTEVLRTCTYISAANTLLRSRASRGHLNLFSWISATDNEVTAEGQSLQNGVIAWYAVFSHPLECQTFNSSHK